MNPVRHIRTLPSIIAAATPLSLAAGPAQAARAPLAGVNMTWILVWFAVLVLAIFLGYLRQNRVVRQKTGELRRELFERQLAEKELLASQHSLRRSLAEKEALLKEVHHRVKNNLQIVSSLLYLQEDYMEDPRGVEILRESQSRVKSMALIHEQLYGTADLAHIDFDRYVQGLAANLQHVYGIDPARIRFDIRADRVALGVDMAVPCGLIINELVSNALKHAFPPDSGGSIRIDIRRHAGGRMEIKVSDDGTGLPSMPADAKRQSLGLRLIDTLVTQLDGTLTVDRTNGTQFSIVLNLQQQNDSKGRQI